MARPTRPSVATFATAAMAALALWVSSGALAFVDAGSRAPYVGVLPPLWRLAAAIGLGVVAAFILARAGASAADLSPIWWSAVLVVPWVPLPWPAAVFLWTGHIVWWVWTSIVVALVARWIAARPPAFARRVAPLQPGRSALLSAMLAFAVYGGAAWAASPQHPNGDEPHYLIIAQSLLEDHDLQIENNHRQRDYRAYVDVGLKPDFLNRGKNGEIYSIHAPGLPAAIAPFFAAGGYPLVVVALTILSAAVSSGSSPGRSPGAARRAGSRGHPPRSRSPTSP
jgi:hypothetical protein